jgi:hypothetical protein
VTRIIAQLAVSAITQTPASDRGAFHAPRYRFVDETAEARLRAPARRETRS